MDAVLKFHAVKRYLENQIEQRNIVEEDAPKTEVQSLRGDSSRFCWEQVSVPGAITDLVVYAL